MSVEIALLDGTKLRTEDPALEEEEILKALDSAKVSAAIKEIHSYMTPAILVLPIESVEQNYLNWIIAETAAEGAG